MLKARLCFRLALAIVLLVCAAGFTLQAQSIFGTITGTVVDASGAVVPNADVTLKNTASGDVRKTVTNSDGYYSFSSVPAGSYSATVEATGFQRQEQTDIHLEGAAKLNFNFNLQVGSSKAEVQVVSAADQIIPVDSGEKSAVLTQKQLQDFTVVGRSAAEFIKILPGMAITGTGTANKQGFTGEVIGINGNGDGGSQSALNGAFSANGLGAGSIDITADGAHVSDPGCNCATPVNPNTDMIQEFKVLTSNFGAENAKGPVVISTIAKAGGQDYHGEGYLYARHYALNANEWLNNKTGTAKPENKYFFPGGNIGGPVLIPGTGFNKNRDKLFFFSGFEYYFQTLDTGLLKATVPTQAMRGGDYSPAELAKLGNITASGAPAGAINQSRFPGGIVPQSQIDPTGQGLMNLYPLPNADPNATGGYNYIKDEAFDQNSWQWMSRVDYSISDNTKLFVRYNLQKERQLFPVGLWWRNGGQLPYPTPIVGKNQSQSVSASLTHVFSPTMSNEFVFAYTYIDFPNVFDDPSKVDRTQLHIPFTGVYKNGVKQIPSLNSGAEMAGIFNPGGFEAGGSKGLFADKYLPTVSDNLSKVWGTHTAKFGFYYEYVINNQPANNNTNGSINESVGNPNSTGNVYADLLTGQTSGYNEANFNNLHNEAYNTVEFFAQDSWKVTRRLTLDYGLRVSHFSPWYDRQGIGFAVWDPSLYNASAAPTDYTGLTWHKRNGNIPLSGFASRSLFWAPRFGLAFDVFGTGKTVLRGGWGQYYYHNSQFTQGLDAPTGVQSQSYSNQTFTQLQATNPAVTAIGTGAVDQHDDHTPLTTSYSFTISQRVPWSSLFEISYVGNQSKYLLNQNGTGTNVNAVPNRTLLNIGTDPNNLPNVDAYRPFSRYQDLNVANHNLYSNYNGMQISWVRQHGNYDFSLNYTYSKALGVVGNFDNLNVDANYGAMAFDRRHIFNAAYSFELPSPAKSNKILIGVANGWQLSGITQIQSGINLSGNTSENFNLNTNKTLDVNGQIASNLTIVGTPSIALQPILTCNPRSGLGTNQFVNGNCFAVPTTPGQNGPTIMPEVFGPAFFNSDLSLFKNFQISESKKLQFRFEAYNFLNHPLWSFNGGNNLNLIFDPATGKINNPVFGITTEKAGHRILQLAIKYYF